MAKNRLLSGVIVAAMATGFAATVAGAQSSGEDTEVREVKNFNMVRLEGSFDVTVNVGGDQRVELVGEAEDFDNVETRVRRNTLVISWDHDGRRWRDHDDVDIEITVPSLIGFGIEGSGDVEVYKVDSDEFSIQIAGSGDMLVTGQCGELEIDIAGSGDVEGEDFSCKSVSIDIAGSGDVEITATDSIDADIRGSGDVTVFGSPSGIRLRQRGSGDVEIVDEK